MQFNYKQEKGGYIAMTIKAIIDDIKEIHETPAYYFGNYHELNALS